jgi:hypothetical protein
LNGLGRFIRVWSLTGSVGIEFREAVAVFIPSFAGKMIAESRRSNAPARAENVVLSVITLRRPSRFTSGWQDREFSLETGKGLAVVPTPLSLRKLAFIRD